MNFLNVANKYTLRPKKVVHQTQR